MARSRRLLCCAWIGLLPLVALAQAQQQAPLQPQPQAPAPERGRQLVESRCFACHSLDANRVGPALRGVVGRVAGKAPDFAYSAALVAATQRWDAGRLKRWLTDPEQLLPGQAMNYRLDEAQDRDDVVAYLATLSPASRP
jgi:cytochrome c